MAYPDQEFTHALAIAHFLAISLVRIKGMKAIRETTEWITAH
jgi:hypothetical protein